MKMIILLVAVFLLYLVVDRISVYADYRFFIRLLREDGYTKGEAIDFADAHPEVWM